MLLFFYVAFQSQPTPVLRQSQQEDTRVRDETIGSVFPSLSEVAHKTGTSWFSFPPGCCQARAPRVRFHRQGWSCIKLSDLFWTFLYMIGAIQSYIIPSKTLLHYNISYYLLTSIPFPGRWSIVSVSSLLFQADSGLSLWSIRNHYLGCLSCQYRQTLRYQWNNKSPEDCKSGWWLTDLHSNLI